MLNVIYYYLLNVGVIKDEEGQGMVEYALLIGLIAIAVIAVLILMGDQITAKFQQIVDALTPAA